MPSVLQRESYGSVEITWLDREAARSAARAAAAEIARSDDNVAGVILFGSIQRGDAVPGSDVDLLVVLSHSDAPYLERLAMDAPRIDGLGVEIFPYTVDEVLRLREDSTSIVSAALREGEWIVGPPEALEG